MHISVNIFYRYILSRCGDSSGRARSPPQALAAWCTRAPAGRRRGWRRPWTPAPWPGQLELSLLVSDMCCHPASHTGARHLCVHRDRVQGEPEQRGQHEDGTGTDVIIIIITHQCYPGGDHHRQPAHHLAQRPAAQIQPRPGHHRQR